MKLATANGDSTFYVPHMSTMRHGNGNIRVNNPSNDRPIFLFFLGFTVVALISINLVGIDFKKIIDRSSDLTKVIEQLIQLDFSEMNVIVPAFFESIWVAILGTVYSMFAGLLFGILMAGNITPAKWLAPVTSGFFTMIRAIPTLIWVLLVLVCLGFGPGPGIVGIAIHSTAFFARAFAQSFEEVPQSALEALDAVGANRIKSFFSAVLPSSLTALIAWTALSFEMNFGQSTILGVVGAGGIGYVISMSMSGFKYGRGMVAIIMVFIFSYILEMGSTVLKQKLKV